MTTTWMPGNWIEAIGHLARLGPMQTGWAWDARRLQYAAWDAYVANAIYDSTTNGGQRDNINRDLGNAAAADLSGLFNPIAAVVDLYLHTLSGEFGNQIRIETKNPRLVEPINRIWQWSNINIEKQRLCRLPATHGCCGIRIVARDDDDPLKRRVYLKPEHPSVIRDIELDDRGNVEAVQLEYTITTGLAEKQEVILIREEMTKERFTSWRIENGTAYPFDLFTMTTNGEWSDYENPYGIVPYVLLRHEHDGSIWGRNAFYRARPPLDRLNALLSHIDVQIHKHVNGVLFVAAAGAPPSEIDLSGLKVAYVDTSRSQTAPPPFMEWMVADLDLAGALAQAQEQRSIIEDMLPELKAVHGRFISGQSGETITELRKPAEDRIALARTNYEDALVRSQEIALTCGIVMGLWDIGTGTGTIDAAERAYRGGFEDHTFNKRPLLSADVSDDAPTQSPPQPTEPDTEDTNGDMALLSVQSE